eukprot:3249451-Pleurochrysis_carterae.AAC.1
MVDVFVASVARTSRRDRAESWVCAHAHQHTCRALLQENEKSTDCWHEYQRKKAATGVRAPTRAWA